MNFMLRQLRQDRRIMPCFGAIIALALIAASSGRLQAQTHATVILPGFRSPVRMDTIGTPHTVAAQAGVVYGALTHVFDRLKLEPDVLDSASLAVGTLKLQVMRTFLGATLSRSVDCGIGSGMRGARADFDRVHLAILATVKPLTEGSSELKLAVAAGSQAIGGTLGDQISCVSTGWIEEKVQRMLDEELARKSP